MTQRRGWFAVVCCLLLASPLVGAASAGALSSEGAPDARANTVETADAGGLASQEADPWQALQEDIDADAVRLVAAVDENGDADWQVIYRLRLDSDADRQAFSDLEADIEANTSAYLDPFEGRIRDTVGTAVTATDREMAASNFTVSTRREEEPQVEFGLVTFSYEWRGFAVAEGDEIRIGDAVDQLFLDEDERIEFQWPGVYALESSAPEPDISDDGRAVYRGRFSFDAGQPRLVVTRGGSSDGSSLLPILGGLAVIAVAVVAGVLWWRRREDGGEPATEPPVATTEATQAEAADQEADQGPPPDLLSNEERLLTLLEQHGGRMKQTEAADQLDWSAAKTSQVVGDLRDADKLQSFRLGRENVLTLPEVDIDEPVDNEDDDSSGE